MKRAFFTLIFFILTVSVSSAQKTNEVPSLKDLAAWASKSYTEFQTEVVKFKFTFKEEKEDYWTKLTKYVYQRKPVQGDSIVADRVVFRLSSDGQSSIEVFFSEDLVTLYSGQLSSNNFKKAECRVGVGENSIQYCYSNEVYNLTITATKQTGDSGKSVTSYSALIYKKRV